MADWRVVFYNGHLFYTRAAPEVKVNEQRTFAYDKLASYSQAITEAFNNSTEDEGTAIALHSTTTQDHPLWKSLLWWKLTIASGCPLLDEPFREILTILEALHDKLDGGEAGPTDMAVFDLPKIDGITKEVPIFKLARLYWSAKHLRLQAPLRWESELRSLLLREIQAIDTNSQYPAIRIVDFWYIWGAFRELDEPIVDAMIQKLVDAIDHKTDPVELNTFVIEQKELQERIRATRNKRGKKTWAEQLGSMSNRRGTHAPSKLSITTNSVAPWRLPGPKTTPSVISSTIASAEGRSPAIDATKAATPVSAPVTILRRDSAASAAANEDGTATKKDKGSAFTEPTGTAPPSAGKKNERATTTQQASWGGSSTKRGKKGGRGGRGGGGAGRGGGSGENGSTENTGWGWK